MAARKEKKHVLTVSLHTKEPILKDKARKVVEAVLSALGGEIKVGRTIVTVTKASVRRVDIE